MALNATCNALKFMKIIKFVHERTNESIKSRTQSQQKVAAALGVVRG